MELQCSCFCEPVKDTTEVERIQNCYGFLRKQKCDYRRHTKKNQVSRIVFTKYITRFTIWMCIFPANT